MQFCSRGFTVCSSFLCSSLHCRILLAFFSLLALQSAFQGACKPESDAACILGTRSFTSLRRGWSCGTVNGLSIDAQCEYVYA